MRTARYLVALLLLLAGAALAQSGLVVNGRPISGNDTTLVPGTSYAPAAALAQALGATLAYDGSAEVATLVVGGRVLQVRVVADPADAVGGGDALWLDGRPVPGGAAVHRDGELFVPVKPVSEALGASVTYMSANDTVVVVQPRGRLTAMRHGDGHAERLELAISAPVRYTTYLNEPLGTLHVYLERTDVEVRLPPVEGESFTLATVAASGGATEVRVQLEPGVGYDVYAVPDGRGFRLNVTFTAPGARRGPEVRVVLDPGHGGADSGVVTAAFGSEATLTLGFAERLAAALRARGMSVTLTRDSGHALGVDERSRAGVGADLFLSLHAADLPLGEYRAYYLGDAANVQSLEMAVRENAGAALRQPGTDELRRRLLLGLVPDLDVGRRTAEGLAARLSAIAGYRAGVVAGAPLQVLGGAAGRGLLLEFSAADLASDGLPERLADALAQLVDAGSLGLEGR